jgi:hypothetical protein
MKLILLTLKITNKRLGFIKRHSTATYYALVFAISWGFILAVIGSDAFLGTTQMSGTQAPFVYIATLAGIVMVTIVNGRTGLKDIQSRKNLKRMGVQLFLGGLGFFMMIIGIIVHVACLQS